MTSHHLAASPETCHWGVFDAALSPVLEVASGDTVTIDTVSGSPEVLPPAGFHVPPELLDIHARSARAICRATSSPGRSPLQAPLPGDVLEIRMLDVKLRQDWGYNVIRPLSGALPDDFDAYRHVNIPLDPARNVAHLPWGVELPLAPFFGILGVAPPPHWGMHQHDRAAGARRQSRQQGAASRVRRCGCRCIRRGALFSCGDGHGAQGDGEVCTTAIETAMQGTFELILHKRMHLDYPRRKRRRTSSPWACIPISTAVSTWRCAT